eukprot:TRINITY_DN3930_c0_g1_i3.p1 TRINITY_DN3930_c0_g1~~TRINITY_DN3930_c0_g1_i3.p1  ORF type:complete len:530 (+),score=84.25 TRINITY_DN3930_c0_g1_i3:49-1638(+)
MDESTLLYEGWLKVKIASASSSKRTFCRGFAEGILCLYKGAQDAKAYESIDCRELSLHLIGDCSGDEWSLKNGEEVVCQFVAETKREGERWSNIITQMSLVEKNFELFETKTSSENSGEQVPSDIKEEAKTETEAKEEVIKREIIRRNTAIRRIAEMTSNIQPPTITFNSHEWKSVTFADGRLVQCQHIMREGAVSHGVITWTDGCSYSGQISDGRPHGLGVYLDSMKNRYLGQFLNGKKHGLGVYEWGDGDVYAGQFKNDQESGKGTWESASGAYFIGEYIEGQWGGHGESRSEEGEIVKAVFKEGTPSKLMDNSVSEQERDGSAEMVNRAKLMKQEAYNIIPQAETASLYGKTYVETALKELEKIQKKREHMERLAKIKDLCLLERRCVHATTMEEYKSDAANALSFPANVTIAIYSWDTNFDWFGELHGSYGFFPKDKIDVSSMGYAQDAKLSKALDLLSTEIAKATAEMLEVMSMSQDPDGSLLQQAKFVGVGLLNLKRSLGALSKQFSSGVVPRVSLCQTFTCL